MASNKTVLHFGLGQADPSPLVSRFAEETGLELVRVEHVSDVRALLNRTMPACLVIETGPDATVVVELVDAIKADSFTGIVPVAVVLNGTGGSTSDLLEAGADEVVNDEIPEREQLLRLEQVLKRADRDVSVHPTTRLPGTNHIARDMQSRLEASETFAVCYADLDHFKEFNDRYGYALGDAVIRLLSRILRDIVRGLAPGGFVGHIGGDDFIFNVPVEYLEETCDEIIFLFDELIPYQYTEEDRRAGYFLGEDRRGNVHRVPLMGLSIGVVTNQFQTFDHPGMISELAAEMKSFAKSLPGSKYVVDRRQQPSDAEGAETRDEQALAGAAASGPPTM